MGETTERIEKEIQQERGELDKNLQELEQRVRDTTDWRVQFDRHPMLLMGVALGAGVALSAAMGGRKRNGSAEVVRRVEEASVGPQKLKPHEPSPWSDTFNTLKGALIGVGTDRLCNFVEERIPGFQQRFNERARTKGSDAAFSSARRSAA